ncbi:acidic amino acid decarboxylase GADL1 [Eupeodes corollae]|uniref:acidic amino acid decarboxylase GADL1 n=1 Tax=Eupeodes corollae TaxID=290404 RepID=UPI0024905756|nr:acidic amino acid decarboxylase GADL1 [Eupeodes corollae]
MNPTVEKIRQGLPADWEVLRTVYELLRNANVFCVNDNNEKIVEFVQPAELKKLIDLSISEDKSLNETEILSMCRKVIQYSVKTTHNRFHNQLFGQMDPYGLFGSWITEALNTSAYTFEVGPVFSLIETEVIKKMCDICGYANGDGIFAPGGSISNMYALALARYKICPDIKAKGIFGIKPLVLFTSEESHYSFKKAANWLGLGTDNCVCVKTNARGQMLPLDLEAKILEAKKLDKTPFFVNSTAGTTVLGAFDDLNDIADVCQRYGLWLHVDGCHGASVLISKENRHLMNGVERSDSLAWNPHKALGAPLQCAMFLTREKDLMSRCNSTEVKYLFQQDKFYDVSYDTGNKSIQCGRKIDSFKFWLMLKARGVNGLGSLVDHAIKMAKIFVQKLLQREGYRLVQDSFSYTNVCFWYIPKAMRGQEENSEWEAKLYTVAPKIKEKMIRSGTLMVGYSPLAYRGVGNFIRMIFTCYPVIDEKELDAILDEIEFLAEQD